jgi:hypothetical protein
MPDERWGQKRVQTLLFPPDLLSVATVEQIEAAVRGGSPKLTAWAEF